MCLRSTLLSRSPSRFLRISPCHIAFTSFPHLAILQFSDRLKPFQDPLLTLSPGHLALWDPFRPSQDSLLPPLTGAVSWSFIFAGVAGKGTLGLRQWAWAHSFLIAAHSRRGGRQGYPGSRGEMCHTRRPILQTACLLQPEQTCDTSAAVF